MAKQFDMQSVLSSQISALGYDEESETLRIEFTSGATYDYEGVDPDTYASLRDAGSVGGYFAQAIKGRFTYRRVG